MSSVWINQNLLKLATKRKNTDWLFKIYIKAIPVKDPFMKHTLFKKLSSTLFHK